MNLVRSNLAKYSWPTLTWRRSGCTATRAPRRRSTDPLEALLPPPCTHSFLHHRSSQACRRCATPPRRLLLARPPPHRCPIPPFPQHLSTSPHLRSQQQNLFGEVAHFISKIRCRLHRQTQSALITMFENPGAGSSRTM